MSGNRPDTLNAVLAFKVKGIHLRKTITLFGIRIGCFVIHQCISPDEYPYWQITHAPSGMRVGKDYIYKSIVDAVSVAEKLHDPVWQNIRSQKSRGLEKAKLEFFKVRKEIYG